MAANPPLTPSGPEREMRRNLAFGSTPGIPLLHPGGSARGSVLNSRVRGVREPHQYRSFRSRPACWNRSVGTQDSARTVRDTASATRPTPASTGGKVGTHGQVSETKAFAMRAAASRRSTCQRAWLRDCSHFDFDVQMFSLPSRFRGFPASDPRTAGSECDLQCLTDAPGYARRLGSAVPWAVPLIDSPVWHARPTTASEWITPIWSDRCRDVNRDKRRGPAALTAGPFMLRPRPGSAIRDPAQRFPHRSSRARCGGGRSPHPRMGHRRTA